MAISRVHTIISRVSVLLLLGLLLMAVLVNLTELRNVTWLRVLFGVSALNFTLRAAVPLILGALSGLVCERTGIINIGIEGQMLMSAFGGFFGAAITGSLVAGALIGVGTGMIMGALLATGAVAWKMDQIIAGSPLVFRENSREGESTIKYDLTLQVPLSHRVQAGVSQKFFRVRYDAASPLARAEWLAVGEAQGQAKGARITGAIATFPTIPAIPKSSRSRPVRPSGTPASCISGRKAAAIRFTGSSNRADAYTSACSASSTSTLGASAGESIAASSSGAYWV